MSMIKQQIMLGVLSIGVMGVAGCQSLVSTLDISSGQRSHRLDPAPGNVEPGLKPPKSESSLCEETARTMAEGGYVREAILLYEKAEAASEKPATYDRELASLYASSGNYEKSIERYRRILKDQVTAENLNNYVWTLTESGQIEAAYQEIRNATERFPDDPRLSSTFAVIEYKRGNRESAFRLFEKLHGAAAAYHNVAVLDIDSGHASKAIEYLELAVRMSDKPNPLTVELLNQMKGFSTRTADSEQSPAGL